jgi:hypothetical protein
VAAEAAKVFKGSGASDLHSIQEWENNFNENSSPEQIKAASQLLVNDLLKSRIDTIRNQYHAAMGRPAEFTFLTPHSREVLQSLGVDPSEMDTGAASNPAPNATGLGGVVDYRNYFGGR